MPHKLDEISSSTDFADAVITQMPRLAREARRFFLNRADAEDLVQETLCKALRAHRQFDSKLELAPWLNKIMRHVFIDEYRAKRSRPSLDTGEPVELVAIVEANQYWSMRQQEVAAAINCLPVAWAVALIQISSGSTYQEAASFLQRDVNTVKTHVRRARLRLEELGENEI